jgi:hypothetical protein
MLTSPSFPPSNLTRKDVKGIVESMVSIGHAELKKNGVFVVPGLVRMIVIKKPATSIGDKDCALIASRALA